MYTEHGDPRIHRACAEMYLLGTSLLHLYVHVYVDGYRTLRWRTARWNFPKKIDNTAGSHGCTVHSNCIVM